jgi:hypothetical protein
MEPLFELCSFEDDLIVVLVMSEYGIQNEH